MGYLSLQLYDSVTTTVSTVRQGENHSLEDRVFLYTGPENQMIWTMTPDEAEVLLLQLQAALAKLDRDNDIEQVSNGGQMRLRD